MFFNIFFAVVVSAAGFALLFNVRGVANRIVDMFPEGFPLREGRFNILRVGGLFWILFGTLEFFLAVE